jgi:hypothetical protein
LLGRTNILDGDVTPLLDFPGLTAFIDGRRHYRPPAKELKHLEPESEYDDRPWTHRQGTSREVRGSRR